jgi:phosphatidylglycerophosphate synthase
VFQMATVLAAMAGVYFQLVPPFVTTLLAWVTAGFTITSGMQYIAMGLRELETHHSMADRL